MADARMTRNRPNAALALSRGGPVTKFALPSVICAFALSGAVPLCAAAEPTPESAVDDSVQFDGSSDGIAPAPLEESAHGPQFTLEARSTLAFRTDVQGTDADVLVSHSGLAIGMRQRLGDQFSISAKLGFEYSYYDFSGGAVVDGVSDPFSDLYSLGGVVTLSYAINDQWALFGSGFLGVAGESGADVGDSLLGGGGFGVNWRPSDWFNVSIGLAIRSQLEDDAIFSPIIDFTWRLSETMRLETRDFPQGAGIGLTWELDTSSEFTLFGGVEYRQWRLDGGSGELRDGVIRDLRVPLGAAMLWRLSPGFSLELEGGAIVYQEYEFLDSTGNRIEDLDSDIAPFVGVKIQWTF